jgi:pimeloyl-ACP methyl ester carboxylesterase
MRRHICCSIIALVSNLVLAACNMPSIKQPSTRVILEGLCGDRVCGGVEDTATCPIDCQPIDSTAQAAGEEGVYRVTNPTSNAQLYMKVVRPQIWDGEALPTLILIPGGNDDSSGFFTPGQNQAQRITDAGFVVVVFDLDGRGRSEGDEDYGGVVHQDGLAAVVQQAATLPEVDSLSIGLVSFSYGITIASGALARHSDLPVLFLIDWEGPADRNDTGGCDVNHTGHLTGIGECGDEAFWSQREALTFISQIKVPYQRIQSEKDHIQPDNVHAVAMINASVNGGAPWVRLNDLEPNQTYDLATPPAMLPEGMDEQHDERVIRYALELLMR